MAVQSDYEPTCGRAVRPWTDLWPEAAHVAVAGPLFGAVLGHGRVERAAQHGLAVPAEHQLAAALAVGVVPVRRDDPVSQSGLAGQLERHVHLAWRQHGPMWLHLV